MLTQKEVATVLSRGSGVYRMVARWQYLGGDGFFDALLIAAAHADAENLARLRLSFPDVADAVHGWRNVPGFSDEFERWCREEAAKS